MSVINNNIIVDGYLLVSKSATINGQINTASIIAINDITANGNSLRTIGEYLNFPTINTNTKFGKNAFQKESSGVANSCIGYQSMINNASGSYNNVIGYNSLYNNISGFDNNGMGYNVLYSNISGKSNIGIGSNSLYSNTIGGSNIGVGYNSLRNNQTGTTNIAIGDYSMSNSEVAINNNIAIGVSSLYNNQNSDNIAIGVSSLYNNTTGNKNIGLGNSTLLNNTTGSYNIGIGSNSLISNIVGLRNIGLGIDTLVSNKSNDNIAVGYQALNANVSGNSNIALGYQTLNTNVSGNNNIAAGYQSLNANISGDNNIGIGYQALNANLLGTNNIAIGYQANNTNTNNISTISIGLKVSPSANNQIVIGNGGYDGYLNLSSLCIGKNNYTTSSNYQVVVNNTLTTTNDVFLNSNNISVGNTTSNISFVASNMNFSTGSNMSFVASNININTSTFNISAANVGLGTRNPTGKLHIYETFGSGDISTFIWNQIGSSNPNGSINAIAVDSTGKIYVGGSFSTIGSLSSVNNIASWDSTNGWSALGGATKGVTDASSATIHSIAIDSNNNVYVGGRFTNAGAAPTGTITVNNIAKWNGSSWSAIGQTTTAANKGLFGASNLASNCTIYSITFDSINNLLYIGGTINYYYVGTSTATNLNNIAKYTISTDTFITVGTDGGTGGIVGASVRTISIDSTGKIYAGGDFTSDKNIKYYNSTTTVWSTVGTGTNNIVYTSAIDSNNNLYIGGNFTTANDSSANYIAKWNGSSWSPIIYNGNNGLSGTVRNIVIDSQNNIYVGGLFTTAGGVTVNNIAEWNGSFWSSYNSTSYTTVGISGGTFPVKTLFISTNYLYIGGDFTAVGSNSAIQYLTYLIYTNYGNNSISKGTLVLEHGNNGGCSSIIFPSKRDNTSDYGYIMYRDNVSETNTSQYGRLEIGTENDVGSGLLSDALILQKNGGYVGIGTSTPLAALHVNGSSKFDNQVSVDSLMFPSTSLNPGPQTSAWTGFTFSTDNLNFNTTYSTSSTGQFIGICYTCTNNGITAIELCTSGGTTINILSKFQNSAASNQPMFLNAFVPKNSYYKIGINAGYSHSLVTSYVVSFPA